jgi:TetR/AcrR family transcriptional repressor of lmrAB and yxaGH operons
MAGDVKTRMIGGAVRLLATRGLDGTSFSEVLELTVATDSPELLGHAASVFRSWRGRLAILIEASGLSPDASKQFAATLVASCEGAVVVCRAEQDLEVFELVSESLRLQLESLRHA